LPFPETPHNLFNLNTMKKKLLFMAIALICSLSYSQGDTCAAATTVSCGAGELDYNSYTTTGFTDTAGNSTNDVFFTITPASVETINIELCATSTDRDTRIVVYSDCSLSTIVVENDAGRAGCSFNANVSFVADGVSSYIIMVEGGTQTAQGSTGSLKDGDFVMVVFCTPPPVIQIPVGCTAQSSGAVPIFTNSFEDEDAVTTGVQITKWDGDIFTVPANSNSGSWEILPAGSPSTGDTGPISAYVGDTYMNYEASSPNGGTTASAVYQDAIDLTPGTYESAELTFWMHAFGNQMGDLSIGVGTSASGPFATEYTWSGEYQTAAGENWVQVGVDLTSYLGQVIYIEFSYGGSTGQRGDMSIDKVEVNACDTVLNVENNEETIKGITLYPNPVRDYLNLRSIDQIEQISVYNLLGQQVRFSSPSNSQTSIDMTSLETGIYIVKIKAGGKTGNYKIIKE
jgi:hypothetical protein